MRNLKEVFNFSDKVILITGASGGIGSSVVEVLYSCGASLVLVSRSKQYKSAIGKQLKDTNRILVVNGNLLIESDIKRIVKITLKKFKKIDILINCAGINIRKELKDYTVKDWDQIMDLNLKSAFTLMNSIGQTMKTQREGKIINISSIQGLICWKVGDFVMAPYCASKAGIISLTKTFALDLAPYGITVNAICPSVIKGKWAKNVLKNQQIYQDIISRTPLGRIATNFDVTGTVLFLASPLSDFITGQTIVVDGGWTIQ